MFCVCCERQGHRCINISMPLPAKKRGLTLFFIAMNSRKNGVCPFLFGRKGKIIKIIVCAYLCTLCYNKSMKKVYIEPKIKSVALDPEQAILQVCETAGVWMYSTRGMCEYTGGSNPFSCETPRGPLPTASTQAAVGDTDSAGS